MPLLSRPFTYGQITTVTFKQKRFGLTLLSNPGMVCSNVAKSPLGEDNGQNCDGKGKFTSLVAGKGSKGQNRDGKGKPKCKGQNEGKAKFTSLLGDHTPSAPPVNTFRSSLDVDVERFTNGQSLGVLLARDSRSHSRKFEAQLPRCCRRFCFPLGRPM